MVIILSGSSDHARIGSALDAGAVAWVSKNALFPALLAAVRAAQEGRPTMADDRRERLIALSRGAERSRRSSTGSSPS